MKIISKIIFICITSILLSCDEKIEDGVMKSDLSKDIEMVTSYGTIIMRLSDDTPKHRNNFIKRVNQKFYDSIQFHRVINNFLIQTGDYKTKPSYKTTKNNTANLPGLVEPEFTPNLFHKRGALNAAREGDYANPSQSSSDSQFTIIQGRIQTDSILNLSQKRINQWRAKNKIINRLEYKDIFDKYKILSKKIDEIEADETEFSKDEITKTKTAFAELQSKINSYNLDSIANIELKSMKKYKYPKAHREIYKTLGGAPHLDQNYTVFGEVIKGMNIVDSIAATLTDNKDKPIDDVYIIKARMIKRKSYNEN